MALEDRETLMFGCPSWLVIASDLFFIDFNAGRPWLLGNIFEHTVELHHCRVLFTVHGAFKPLDAHRGVW
jgi:hypothetical protein